MLQDVRVLVAGVGNVLRGDDGFGVVVAQRLLAEPVPQEVRVLDVGIGGIHLVQELLDHTEALVVVDAVELGRPPGTIAVIRPDVRDVKSMSLLERHDELADMHYATPERALMLAQALDVLPVSVWIVGCQPEDADRLGEGLSAPLAAAVEPAIGEVRQLVRGLGVRWEP
jgi:hydrogenase maturation protease